MDEGMRQGSPPPMEKLPKNTFWLTRIVFLRLLGLVYFTAFLVAYHQNEALIGQNGLEPADKFLGVLESYANRMKQHKLAVRPTVLYFLDRDLTSFWLASLAAGGCALSLAVFITGAANMIALGLLWAAYHSIHSVGQTWYGFGWETQLLETGFLAIWMVPMVKWERVPSFATPWPVVWGYRWLIIRIMLGAGLIKLRGDQCWRDLTCMQYHYETQPVPNPLSSTFHHFPNWFHTLETLANHYVEIAAPFFILLPRGGRTVGGVIQILFQVLIILSGNLSFLNWLTILPPIFCLDDRSLAFLFPKSTQRLVNAAAGKESKKPKWRKVLSLRSAVNIILALTLGYYSIPVVQNLLSHRQAMNTSFNSLAIVNTYGAFGSITKERNEIIIQGTLNNTLNSRTVWLDYEFKCKPGHIDRRPCLLGPYHYRLDWLAWFAGFGSSDQHPWVYPLLANLLVNDERTLSLMAPSPFNADTAPQYVRVELYNYRMATPGWMQTVDSFAPPALRKLLRQYGLTKEDTRLSDRTYQHGKWWHRRRVRAWLPPVDLAALGPALKQMGLPIPARRKG